MNGRRYGVLRPRLVPLAIGACLLVAASLPPGVARQVPRASRVLGSARLATARPARDFRIVAIGRRDEEALAKSDKAPTRPLIIFERRGDRFVEVARNDRVVLKIDEGGQCDPFLDGGGTIAVKNRFFTVENGVACGQHWTDYVTFRLEGANGFVFDNERSESWSLNDNTAPDAEALVRDGPPTVRRDRPGHMTRFAAWRPKY